ncbi:MAG TPA: hypothetical protein VKA84_17930 [Gemmatimonadaceae bacterium]|nr:hypothetical protein [Gemmatimonadaceae bacterium]
MSDEHRTDEQEQQQPHPQVGSLPEPDPANGDDAAVRGGALNAYMETVQAEKQGKSSITDGTSNTLMFSEKYI